MLYLLHWKSQSCPLIIILKNWWGEGPAELGTTFFPRLQSSGMPGCLKHSQWASVSEAPPALLSPNSLVLINYLDMLSTLLGKLMLSCWWSEGEEKLVKLMATEYQNSILCTGKIQPGYNSHCGGRVCFHCRGNESKHQGFLLFSSNPPCTLVPLLFLT